MKPELISLFERDIDRLIAELDHFADPSLLWKTSGQISNSAGNLMLHLCGNLNHFIGHLLGGSGYVRNRELEFSVKDVPVDKLRVMIQDTREVVSASLGTIGDEDWKKEFPAELGGKKYSVEGMLLHLFAHLSYHLGQINYLRRMLA